MYERDSLALVDSFVGYGVSALPLKPGPYELTNSIFVANDRNARQTQRVRDFFNNTRPELEGWRSLLLHREEMHASPVVTCGMGNVHVSVTVLTKGMDISGTHVARGGEYFPNSTFRLCDCPYSYHKGLLPLTVYIIHITGD